MAIKDRNGDLHDTNNGQYVSKNKAISDRIKADALSPIFGEHTKYVKAVNGRLPDGTLTKQEWAQWYSAIGDIKLGFYAPKCKKGFLIQIGKKIVITSGGFLNPKAVSCYVFGSEEEANFAMEEWWDKTKW